MAADGEPEAQTVVLAHYKPYEFTISEVSLDFNLRDDGATVGATIGFAPAGPSAGPLRLDGSPEVVLASISLDGTALAEGSGYTRTADGGLVLPDPPNRAFVLRTVITLDPADNTALEGLYLSSGNFCTQCEAESFRKITFFPDRPDVLTRYTTRIEADAAKFPVLLSNGNRTDAGALPGGRHFAVWHDPWPKPCYLFALVAGDLTALEDSFVTASGRNVALRIYTQAHNADKTAFAMRSLKAAMKWDEERYGLEYDLDLFNIVAVDDFNMGAMENKSLNIFNSRLVLASPETASDGDYAAIEGVIGHEYFHNMTGNRITCRDWFQLSLKEGLTVYRDQEFSSDMNSRPVKRIEDVRLLRARQLAEDAGPMAHPVRPATYEKVDNLYSMTVYEKGAEVIRMYETLLGRDGFRKGMDLYFKRHDGQAVTCEDFFAAMRDANGEDIGALFTWYSQAGTPTLTVRVSHDAAAGTLTLVCEQALPATPDAGGDGTKAPQLIPLRVGLLGADGADLPLQLAGEAAAAGGALPTCVVLRCGAPSCTFTFTGLPRGAPPPVPSLLRGYSAPVHLKVVPEPTEEALTFQLAHDSDAFARFEAAQTLGARAVMRAHAAGGAAPSAGDPAWASLCAAFRAVLEAGTAQKLDRVFVAEALSLPGVSELIEAAAPVDPVALWAAREAVVRALAAALEPQLLAAFRAAEAEAEAAGPAAADAYSAAGVERRALRNLALALLAKLGGEHTALVSSAYERARNMTDAAAALRALAATPGAARDAALAHFYGKWRADPLVLVKWFGIQAASNAPGAVAAVAALTAHPDFDWRNPNKVYATLCGFARASYAGFHAADGSGYALLADAVLKLDAQNPQVAARVADAFTQWRKYDAGRQAAMRAQLERIVAHPGLSANVREIAGKSLK